MSAQDLRAESRHRRARLENETAAVLIEDFNAPQNVMNYRQGIIQGLRLAAQAEDDAFKAVTGDA